jgi:hypothetical protein
LFGHYPSQQLQPDTPLYRQEWPGICNVKAPIAQAREIRQWSMWSFLSNGWLPSADKIAQALPALHTTQAHTIEQWGQSLKLTRPQSLRLAAWLLKIGWVRSQPPAAHSPQRLIHLICTPTDLAQRPDLNNLLTDERWVLQTADPALSGGERLAAQLKHIAQQGGHAVLLAPQAHVQDFWLAERLHDAWAQLALVDQLPHALAVRHDLLAQVCQSLPGQHVTAELATWAKLFSTTASAQGMATGPWDMAIASLEQTPATTLQEESA